MCNKELPTPPQCGQIRTSGQRTRSRYSRADSAALKYGASRTDRPTSRTLETGNQAAYVKYIIAIFRGHRRPAPPKFVSPGSMAISWAAASPRVATISRGVPFKAEKVASWNDN